MLVRGTYPDLSSVASINPDVGLQVPDLAAGPSSPSAEKLQKQAPAEEAADLVLDVLSPTHRLRPKASLYKNVFGSTGFLGRYVVNRFGRIGSQVITPYRSAGGDYQVQHLRVMGDVGQIVPVRWTLQDDESIYNSLKHSNVVINLVGQRYETRNFNFNQVHVKGAQRIARIAREADVERFVHVSLAPHDPNSDSAWARSKAEGELAVREVFPAATIIRPTVMFGAEDTLLNNIGSMIRYWPVYPLSNPNREIQPVYVDDVADAIMTAVSRPETAGRIYELGGPKTYTMQKFSQYCAEVQRIEPWVWTDPPLMKALVWFLEKHRKPRLTLDELKYTADRVTTPGTLGFKDLGIEPQYFEDKAIVLLRRWRQAVRWDEVVELQK